MSTDLFCIESLENRRLLSANWGAQGRQISQDLAAANFPTINGAHQTIAVVDAGVDYTHPVLGGTFGTRQSKVTAGYDFVEGQVNPYPVDGNWHGTATAGMAAGDGYVFNGNYYQGIAPAARIVAFRATPGHVNDALNWIIANRKTYNIVSVELLGPAAHSSVYLQTLTNDGVFISEPAGNMGRSFPAAHYAGIAMIGSTDPSGQISSFSERGPNLDLVAPGGGVIVPWNVDGDHVELSSDGTSWAAPQVAGAAALLKQIDPALTPRQILSIFQRTGTPTFDSVSNRTYIQLNLNGALTLATELAHATPAHPAIQLQPQWTSPASTPPANLFATGDIINPFDDLLLFE